VTDQHAFLSPGWIEAARGIRAEVEGRVPPPDVPLKANVIVTDTPFEEDEIRGFIDSSDGSIMLELGELADAELTVKTDYETARALFVSQDIQKMMESFMTGKILVTGDVAKILMLTPPTDPEQIELAQEIARRLDDITAG
jgi:hypothetical protein